MKRRRIGLIVSLSLASLSLVLVVSLVLFFRSGGLQDKPDGIETAKIAKDGKVVKEPALPDTFSVAFYNVENLFDFVLDGTEYDEYKPGWFGWTEEVYKKKLENVASVIAAVGADVIGLCEIENMNVLKELQARLDRMDAHYPYAAIAEAPGSATVTAMLSKLPIKEKRSHLVEKSRSILEAKIAKGSDEFVIFVNHWPSKRNPESVRLNAAEVLKRRIDELPAGTDYIITGDLNANYDEFAAFHTAGFNDTKGRTGVNHTLGTVMDGPHPQSPTRFVCKGELATCTDCHYNLWLELPESDRMSYVFRGAKQTIDHILLPPAMFDTVGYSYLNGSFEVFTWDGELLRDGVPYRWQMVFRGREKYHVGRGYSDHLPVKASFVRASVLRSDSVSRFGDDYCAGVDPSARKGDFEVTVDGWMSGDSRFTVARDNRHARNGAYSLRVSGRHETDNKTAAKAKLQPHGTPKQLSMSIRGSGNLSIRVRRPQEKWVYYNAPDFKQSKSARYKEWKSNSWMDLRFPVPAAATGDVEVELRAGKGQSFAVWIDRVRME